jgi:putative peptidoglycan lipid II flippase
VRSGDRAALERSFADTLLLTSALVLPSAVGLALLAQPIFRALFGFEGEAAAGCALALHCYLVGLPPIALARIYTGLCLAHENTRTAAHAAVVALLANLAFSLVLIGPLPEGALPEWATAAQHSIALFDLDYAGLALAASLASLANALYLMLAVRARYGRVLPAGVAGRTGRLVAGCVALALAVAAAAWPFGADPGPSLEIAALAARVAAGAAAYGVVLFALGSPELARLRSLLRRSR